MAKSDYMTGIWYELVYFPHKGQWGVNVNGTYRTSKGACKKACAVLKGFGFQGEVMVREQDFDVNTDTESIGTSSPYLKVCFDRGSNRYIAESFGKYSHRYYVQTDGSLTPRK